MKTLDRLNDQFGSLVSYEQVERDLYQVFAPMYHEDGDMFSMYVDFTRSGILLRDCGFTLMRVSYTFDIRSERRMRILNSIVARNNGILRAGELQMETDVTTLANSLLQFGNLIAKVSNIDILRTEGVHSAFYDDLKEFVDTQLANYRIQAGVLPTNDVDFVVDYAVEAPRPLFLFAVNSDDKALRTVISCQEFHRREISFRSIVVSDSIEKLSQYHKRQILNATDKVFPVLDDFCEGAFSFLSREEATLLKRA